VTLDILQDIMPSILDKLLGKQHELVTAKKIDNDERRLFQHAVTLIRQGYQSTWDNAKIEIILKDARKFTFSSGEQTNSVVVQLDGRDRPQHYYEVEDKGWVGRLHDCVITPWNFTKEVEKSALARSAVTFLTRWMGLGWLGSTVKAIPSK